MAVHLNLPLALDRLQLDVRFGRTFHVHPYEFTLVNRHRGAWLDQLAARLEANAWRPTRPFVANVPKGAGAVRPGGLLALEDQVVYTALLGAALPAILPALNWASTLRDYAYRIWKPDETKWVSAPVWCWEQFRKKSLQSLVPSVDSVVVTDITACYEHVDHEILMSDLRAAGVDEDLLRLLSECLAKWASLNGRGLPQSMTASHLLAKLYLARVDQAMVVRGHNHLRYVDDIRIFATSASAAKRALLDLAELLRDRGLSLQSAKTDFMPPAQARTVFEGSMPVLRELLKGYLADIAGQVGLDADYITPEEAEELINTEQASIPIGLLWEAYSRHILEASKLDRTLFHFLIRRLAKANDAFAVDHCLSLLESHPEETPDILAYLGAAAPLESFEDALVDFFESPSATYLYQAYQFLRWRLDRPEPASARLLTYLRNSLAGGSAPDYFTAVIRALIGRWGLPADLDALSSGYGAATSDLERATIICAIARMERVLRNSFLGKVKGDGTLCGVAVGAVRANISFYVTQ